MKIGLPSTRSRDTRRDARSKSLPTDPPDIGTAISARLECRRAQSLANVLYLPLLVLDAHGNEMWRNTAAARLINHDRAVWRRALQTAIASVRRNQTHNNTSVALADTLDGSFVVRACTLPMPSSERSTALVLQRVCLIRRGNRELHDLSRLTPQEIRVARLMASGCSDAEIASRLRISPHTARSHAERIRRKLHVSSRRQVMPALYTDWSGADA